jgi:hypothetical protein
VGPSAVEGELAELMNQDKASEEGDRASKEAVRALNDACKTSEEAVGAS